MMSLAINNGCRDYSLLSGVNSSSSVSLLSSSVRPNKRSDRLPDALRLVLALDLRLAFDGETRERNRFQPLVVDRLAGHLADAVGAEFDALERLVDLVERVLFLRKQVQREIAVVGVAARRPPDASRTRWPRCPRRGRAGCPGPRRSWNRASRRAERAGASFACAGTARAWRPPRPRSFASAGNSWKPRPSGPARWRRALVRVVSWRPCHELSARASPLGMEQLQTRGTRLWIWRRAWTWA